MPDSTTCANAECGATISTPGKQIGDMVRCPKCGKQSMVTVNVVGGLDLSTSLTASRFEEGGEGVIHPGRLRCSNCRSFLGVRDSVCPKCGADVRTGKAILPPVKPAAPAPARRISPLVIAGGAVLVVVIVVLVVVLAL